MKLLVYHPAAERELDESVVFYENRQRGLGQRFYAGYRESLSRIQDNPMTGFPTEKGTRTYRISSRFPFGVVFQERGDQILIVAVWHFSRRPEYWVDRLDDEL